MFDWFVLLTPVLLLPVFLLLAFVGCAEIFGIEPGVKSPPPPPAPSTEVTFEYAAQLEANNPLLKRIRWEFDATGLSYQGGGTVPSAFNQDRVTRSTALDTGPAAGPPIEVGGDTIEHPNLGDPIGGSLSCMIEHNVNDMVTQANISKNVGDPDFLDWGLDVNLNPF